MGEMRNPNIILAEFLLLLGGDTFDVRRQPPFVAFTKEMHSFRPKLVTFQTNAIRIYGAAYSDRPEPAIAGRVYQDQIIGSADEHTLTGPVIGQAIVCTTIAVGPA